MWRATIKSSSKFLRPPTASDHGLFFLKHLAAAQHHDTRRFSNRTTDNQPRKNNNNNNNNKNRLRSNDDNNKQGRNKTNMKKNQHRPQHSQIDPRTPKARSPSGNSNTPREHKYGSERERTKAILLELINGINYLQRRVIDMELEERPPLWSNREVVLDDQNRQEIFDAAKKLARRLRSCVEDGTLQPSGKHSHEVSVLLERILKLYSSVSILSEESVYDECSTILDLMKRWKVDFQHKHCEYVATVAAYEERWEDAAELFWGRIDPDSGYAPYDVSPSDPVGLYAIARCAQENGTAVVDSVFDAVLRMSMVSPSDQDKYILAAGTAIGHAGEWEDFLNYLRTSYNASQMGQTLVASVMHACILCHRHDEAFQVYDQMVGDLSIAGEWQWGGGEDRIDPLCKDLAMRALGGSTIEDASTRALHLYREVEMDEEKAMSIEALCGVISACHQDSKWEDAIPIFLSVLDKSNTSASVKSEDDLVISDLMSPVSFNAEALPKLGLFLESVMRACNSAGQFGVALLVFRLFELSLPRSFVDPYKFDVPDTGTESRIADALYPTICAFSNLNDLLASTMVSLCGLSCPREAVSLFDVVQYADKSNDISGAHDLYDHATHEVAGQKPFALHPSWESSFRHMHKVTAAFQAVKANDEKLTQDDTQLLASALSTAINSFTISSQAEAGIILARWIEHLSGTGPIVSIDEGNNKERSGFLPITDSLLAAVLEAYFRSGRPDRSLELFEWHVGSDTSLSQRPLTVIVVMRILFSKGRHDDAMILFRKVAGEAAIPNVFSEAAKGLLEADQANAAADVYRLALSSGCVSEELSMLALKAVSLSRGKGRIRIMRNIIDEVARIVGTTGTKWIEAKYWDLKRLIGFSNVSRLMWWDDPKTSRLDELDLALQVLHHRALSGLTPKNDALRLVVASAKAFHPDYIPPDRTGLPRLPRDHASWVRTLSKVLEQAELSTLYEDPKFIEEVALAFYSLRRPDLCIRVVNDALARDVKVNLATLNKVVEAAESSGGSSSDIDEIRMMVAKDTKRI